MDEVLFRHIWHMIKVPIWHIWNLIKSVHLDDSTRPQPLRQRPPDSSVPRQTDVQLNKRINKQKQTKR